MIFLLENIRSKHNIGSIFRSSDAFGVEKIMLTGFCACPPDKDISKTALGAEEYVSWQYFQSIEDAISCLKKEGREIISVELEKGAEDIGQISFKGNEVFILGNEIDGVSKKTLRMSDRCIKIPISGKVKESLNVSVTAAIVAYEVS